MPQNVGFPSGGERRLVEHHALSEIGLRQVMVGRAIVMTNEIPVRNLFYRPQLQARNTDTQNHWEPGVEVSLSDIMLRSDVKPNRVDNIFIEELVEEVLVAGMPYELPEFFRWRERIVIQEMLRVTCCKLFQKVVAKKQHSFLQD